MDHGHVGLAVQRHHRSVKHAAVAGLHGDNGVAQVHYMSAGEDIAVRSEHDAGAEAASAPGAPDLQGHHPGPAPLIYLGHREGVFPVGPDLVKDDLPPGEIHLAAGEPHIQAHRAQAGGRQQQACQQHPRQPACQPACRAAVPPLGRLRRGQPGHSRAEGVIMTVIHTKRLPFTALVCTSIPRSCRMCQIPPFSEKQKKDWKGAANDAIMLKYKNRPWKGAWI